MLWPYFLFWKDGCILPTRYYCGFISLMLNGLIFLFFWTPLCGRSRGFCPLSVCLSVSLTNFVYFSLYYQFYLKVVLFLFFFSIWVFFHEHSRFTGQQEKREGICLTPLYHFHPLHRHLYISRATAAGSSSLRIGSSRTRIGNPWLPSASC